MQKKTAAEVALSIFIAVIFLSSYASFASGNNQGNSAAHSTTPTTAPAPATLYGFAFANAIITGYNNTLNISVSCSSAAGSIQVSNYLSKLLGGLQQNNSVYGFYSVQNQLAVQTGKLNATQLYGYIEKSINSTSQACVSLTAKAIVSIPSQIQMYINSQKYPILVPPNLRTYQIPLLLSYNNTGTVKVKVSALVTSDGTVYSMNVTKSS